MFCSWIPVLSGTPILFPMQRNSIWEIISWERKQHQSECGQTFPSIFSPSFLRKTPASHQGREGERLPQIYQQHAAQLLQMTEKLLRKVIYLFYIFKISLYEISWSYRPMHENTRIEKKQTTTPDLRRRSGAVAVNWGILGSWPRPSPKHTQHNLVFCSLVFTAAAYRASKCNH